VSLRRRSHSKYGGWFGRLASNGSRGWEESEEESAKSQGRYRKGTTRKATRGD